MKMSIIATRGTHTALMNLISTILVATISEMSVRVLLRDEALYRLTEGRISEIVFPEIYQHEREALLARLEAAGLTDIPSMIREAKEQGDVRIFACNSSMGILGLEADNLIAEIDGVRGLTSFLNDEMLESDIVLNF